MNQKINKELIKEVKEYQGSLPLIKELTPELADKIWKSIQRKQYNDKVSKEAVLHELKQLKAHMGKVKNVVGYQNECTQNAIKQCMLLIDKKIDKVKKQ